MKAICIDVSDRTPWSQDDVINRWLRNTHGIDPVFGQALWQLYLDRLICIARAQFGSLPFAPYEKNPAQTAMVSFVRATQAGRFPQINDRHDLWRLLVVITVRRLTRVESAARDDGPDSWGDDDVPARAEQLLGDEPSTELAQALLDTCDELLGGLRDSDLKTVAFYKLEAYSNEEIALLLGLTECTLRRRLDLIRDVWIEGVFEPMPAQTEVSAGAGTITPVLSHT